MDREAIRKAQQLGLRVLRTGELPVSSSELDARAVHAWTSDEFGGVLLVARGQYRGWWVVCAERAPNGRWHLSGGGGSLLRATSPVAPPVPKQPGLLRIGGGTGGVCRHTVGVASEEVSAIRLRSDYSVGVIPLGCTRFFVLGITHHDPITYAIGIDQAGHELPADPLLL